MTCETDSDEEELESRFIPSKEEIMENHKKNQEVVRVLSSEMSINDISSDNSESYFL